MYFDTGQLAPDLHTIGRYAKAVEEIGFDGLWLSETNSDPFLSLTLAAEHTEKLFLSTGIAVAFPRTPAILAMTAWDLARFSNGRFALGLGTQVRAHNERRLGVKWEKPVRKMRETVESIHAFWDCWQNGTKLSYEGEFFKFSLMTPFFTPPPLDVPRPKIWIAAVNKLMLRLVGKRCDGVFIHALHTMPYIKEYCIPHIESGLIESERTLDDVSMTTGVFIVPTDDPRPASEFELFAKQQISFYMSTPAYRVVPEMHGWEATARQLSKMARAGEWAKMPALITDEMMDEIALTGTWAEIGRKTRQKYDGILSRVSYYQPFTPGQSDDGWRTTLAAFRQTEAELNA